MKKTIFLVLTSLMLISCGINCQGEPPKRATLSADNSYGMRYHFSIYIPGSGLQHSPRCPSYDYAKIDIYSDGLGRLRGDEVAWNNSYGEVNFTDYGEDPHNIQLTFSDKEVVINNWDSVHNGTYKIEDTPPDSWGVPIY